MEDDVDLPIGKGGILSTKKPFVESMSVAIAAIERDSSETVSDTRTDNKQPNS